jgi:hypothetical protein
MPLKEPLPSFGMALQPGPKVPELASFVIGDEELMSELIGAEGDDTGLAVWPPALLLLSELPQAASPEERAIAAALTAPARRRERVFIGGGAFQVG